MKKDILMDAPLKTKHTQNNELLHYLKTHKLGITAWDAAEKLGIMRLSARISDLRQRGNNIQTHRCTGRNQHNNPVNYARYILVD